MFSTDAGAAKRVGATTSTLKSRTTTTAATKTSIKAKQSTDAAPVITQEDKKEIPSPETNGEDKIAQEIVEKDDHVEEELVHINGSQQIIPDSGDCNLLLNGDDIH